MRFASTLRSTAAATLALVALALSLPPRIAGAQCIRPNDCMPPPGGCAYPAPGTVLYPNGFGIRNGNFHDPNACQPAPDGGLTVDSFFDIIVELELSTDGGGNWSPRQTVAPGGMRLRHTGTAGDTRFFDTEMLQLQLQGGGLPPGVIIREPPAPGPISRGSASIQNLGGSYRIDSFFDVFTEISLDGGQTWAPGDRTLQMRLEPVQPTPARASTWGTVKIRYR